MKGIPQAGIKPWKNWFHSRNVSPYFPIFSLYCVNETRKRVQGRYCQDVETRPGDRKAYRLCRKQNRARQVRSKGGHGQDSVTSFNLFDHTFCRNVLSPLYKYCLCPRVEQKPWV